MPSDKSEVSTPAAQFGYKRFSGSKLSGQTFNILNLHSDPDPKHSNPIFSLEASGLY